MGPPLLVIRIAGEEAKAEQEMTLMLSASDSKREVEIYSTSWWIVMRMVNQAQANEKSELSPEKDKPSSKKIDDGNRKTRSSLASIDEDVASQDKLDGVRKSRRS